jgi:SAM-dependent methyltransferase
MSKEDVADAIERLMALTVESGGPNCNRLNESLRTLPHLLQNTKTIAYELAKLHRTITGAQPAAPRLQKIGLQTKLCTASDLESAWAEHWRDELRLPFYCHRKSWEMFFVLQALYEALDAFEGKRGLGFACGQEKIPSYLAARRAFIVATDAPPEAFAAERWERSAQHASNRDQLFQSDLLSRDVFDAQLQFEFLDMNDIPSQHREQFDFCWSVCALEHLGSIEQGMRFVENSLSVLKPGGVAVHTTEFNLDEGETIDHWTTVLFQKRHIEALAGRIEAHGGVLSPPDYDEGSSFYDRYIDTPPYDAMTNEVHLKLNIDGFRCTCLGLILRKQ